MDFGPCLSGMSGPVPVPFSEIESWSRLTGIDIPGYEALQLRQLSRDYCNQFHASRKESEPQPMVEGEEMNRKQVSRGFSDLIKQQKLNKK